MTDNQTSHSPSQGPSGTPLQLPIDDFGDAAGDAVREMRQLYLEDSMPWTVGYSGGKDSTAVLQLVWTALAGLPPAERRKPVYVISTDTQVENPIVAAWVKLSLDRMNRAAKRQSLPLSAHQLVPALSDRYWVNLIGRGYPAPRPKFRWCTERLKIRPSHAFINDVVSRHGETLLILGSRKAESAARAKTLKAHEKGRTRDRISINGQQSNSYVYTPIEDWGTDDVWAYLLDAPNLWGHDNNELFEMYKGATEDGECPLVVQTNTRSCGDSRFGCWVCTIVEKDKSMTAMVRNQEDNVWMSPLLALRNEIDFRNMPDGDHELRDFRRMNGRAQLHNGRLVPGPYKQSFREHLLRRVLETQQQVRRDGPARVRDISLINLDELDEIRRLWVLEKHELEDSLPAIYEDVTGEPFPGRPLPVASVFGPGEMTMLRAECDSDAQYALVRSLLAVGERHHAPLHRKGFRRAVDETITRHLHRSAAEAQADAESAAALLPVPADETAPAQTTLPVSDTSEGPLDS